MIKLKTARLGPTSVSTKLTPIGARSSLSVTGAGALLFLTFIFSFFILSAVNLVDRGRKISEQEQRAFTSFPHLQLTGESIKAFPQGIETFLNDRFAFRLPLVTFLNEFRLRLLHVSGSDKVLIGKNGWLFYLDSGTQEILQHEQMSADKLQQFVTMFEQRRLWLARHHIRYFLVFVPAKSEIHREKIPSKYKTMNARTMQDQMLAALRAQTKVDVMDLRGNLLSEKNRLHGPLYLETDSHWNQVGAFVAYRQIAEHLAKTFPTIKPLNWQDVKIARGEECGGDLAGMLGLRFQVHENVPHVTANEQHWAFSQRPKPPDLYNSQQVFLPFATETPDPTLPRAYFVRDSYTINLQPFLSQHFRRALYHWNYFRRPEDDFIPQEILAEKPDIVIQEMAENLLARPVMHNASEVSSGLDLKAASLQSSALAL